MTPPEKDTQRVLKTVRALLDGRDPATDLGGVMLTLEGVVTATLLLVMERDRRKAAAMLNEGLVEGVERRLAYSASKGQTDG